MASPPIRWSRRLPWEHPTNRLTRAVEERKARGLPILDLTETNPTRVGIPYPEEELAEILRRAADPGYEPHPRGTLAAREALAASLSTPGDMVSPDDLILTASTSESYSFLFKLFGDPGEEVLTTAPSYPLLDSLAALEGLSLSHIHLAPGRRFALGIEGVERVELSLTPRTRLLALVHPGNPTGAFLSVAEQAAISDLCASRGLPLISDEVFADYPLDEGPRAGPTAAASGEALSFSLGGLSKSAGLPSWKLGWIRVGGPAGLRRRAVEALEMVADSYLSVGTPVQRALPGVLELAPRIRAAILGRIRGNLAILRDVMKAELLEPAGGWSAVLRVCLPQSDEELALEILDRTGVLVHPGYFFDFETDDFLVLSLLPEPARFAEAACAIISSIMSTVRRPG
ncbi:MAG: alanine-synthesizing transaminase [Acidobacteriota bacterium]|jgi:aspartate/methionine/tyrosine aminotransferase|nr:alanine-synthesizing transaminase [Acidobacteriota bacterium]